MYKSSGNLQRKKSLKPITEKQAEKFTKGVYDKYCLLSTFSLGKKTKKKQQHFVIKLMMSPLSFEIIRLN